MAFVRSRAQLQGNPRMNLTPVRRNRLSSAYAKPQTGRVRHFTVFISTARVLRVRLAIGPEEASRYVRDPVAIGAWPDSAGNRGSDVRGPERSSLRLKAARNESDSITWLALTRIDVGYIHAERARGLEVDDRLDLRRLLQAPPPAVLWRCKVQARRHASPKCGPKLGDTRTQSARPFDRPSSRPRSENSNRRHAPAVQRSLDLAHDLVRKVCNFSESCGKLPLLSMLSAGAPSR